MIRVDLAALRERALRGPGQLLRVEATTVVALVEAAEAARPFVHSGHPGAWCKSDDCQLCRLTRALAPFTEAT